MREYRYPGVLVQQTPSAKPIILFSAQASEIDTWAGVPQKRELNADQSSETTGFQRELSCTRLRQLVRFLGHGENVLQNPLLCARRDGVGGEVRFEPRAPGEMLGQVIIRCADLQTQPLLQLLEHVRDGLKRRLPDILGDREADSERVAELKLLAAGNGFEVQVDQQETEPEDEDRGDASSDGGDEELAAAITEETHILDFYDQLLGRIAILKEIGNFGGEEFLGFPRDSMISFLRPVIVVDGQHRLAGARNSSREIAETDPECQERIAGLVDGGMAPEEAQALVEKDLSRFLPVSLLLDERPQEHVFQFVIVNQKATPIGRPLLGTIVATTLSQEELGHVQSRLEEAGIPLDDSQAISLVTRDPLSPFHGLVQKGLASESGQEVLAWTVMGRLTKIFRELNGGVPFGSRNDYAQLWKERLLAKSKIINEGESLGFESPFEYWRSLRGPWVEVFYRFFASIRDHFADVEDVEAHNFWGKPRRSNLFNKISLMILASDFFQFLTEARKPISSPDEVPELVDDWLTGVSKSYFNRDWRLSGVKKDSTGIRNQWAHLWTEYRKNPSRLPRTEAYKVSRG